LFFSGGVLIVTFLGLGCWWAIKQWKQRRQNVSAFIEDPLITVPSPTPSIEQGEEPTNPTGIYTFF